MAPGLVGFHGLAFLRGGMIAAAQRAAIASRHLRVSYAPSAVTEPISSSDGIWSRKSGKTGASPTLLPVTSPLGRFAMQIACRAMDGPNLQRFLVDADVYLAPDAALWAPVLAGVPLAFAFDLDACRQISRFSGPCEPR